MINKTIWLILLAISIVMCDVSAQLSWQSSIGTNYSQQLLDRRDNPAGAAVEDDFHPSFGAQIEFGATYRLGHFKLGVGLALVYMRFFADKDSFYNDSWIGEERKDGLWTHYIAENHISIEYIYSDNLPSIDIRVLNGIVGQDPLNTFADVSTPYSLGVGAGIKHKINDKLFGRLGYRLYGLENKWKPDKGAHFYPSIWSLDVGYVLK